METLYRELSPRMKSSVVLAGMCLLTAIVIVAILRDAIVRTSEYQVSDTGIGRVAYVPDTAEVTFGVQVSRAVSAEVALRTLNDYGDQIASVLADQDISPSDISVQGYTLNPYYEWTEARGSYISGYDANQQYVVTIHDITADETRVEALINAVTEVGTNQVLSVNFTTENLDTLREEAKQLAIVEAKQHAQQTAKTLGVKLGNVVGWWMNPIQPNYDQLYYGGKGGYGMTEASVGFVPTGEQEVIVEATVTYKLK